MEKPLRESLAQSVCNKLQEEIHKNTWKHTLPGIRSLCSEMLVSKQTMMNALRLLEKSGYVKPAKAGKAREITDRKSGGNSNENTATLVGIITYMPYDELSVVDQNVFKHIYKLFDNYGFERRNIIFNDLISNAGAKNIESILKMNPADIYLVTGASPACSEVLQTLDKPIVYLGGEPVEGCKPVIAFSFPETCSKAINYLVTQGHSKISVMLPENFNRKNRSASQAETRVKAVFDSHKIPFSTYNCPRWGKTRSDFYEALEKLFSITPPTAILIGESDQVPRLISFMLSRGLRYPDDLAIIVLDSDPIIKEYSPLLSHIEKPGSALAKLVFSQTKKLLSNPDNISNEVRIAKSRLVKRDSVIDISI